MPTISDTDVDVDVDVDVDIVDDVRPNDTAIETAETETLTKQEQGEANRLVTNDDKQNDTDERVEHDNNAINNDKIHNIIAENDKSTSHTDFNETLIVANNNNNNNNNINNSNNNNHKHTNEFNDTKIPTIPTIPRSRSRRRSNTIEKIESQSPKKCISISLSSEDSGKESRIVDKRVSVASGEDERKKNSAEQAVTLRVRDNKLGSRDKINADWLTQSIYDIDNRELLLQRLSINNPFYRFRKHSTSLREICASTSNMRKINSDTALYRGACGHTSPTIQSNINVSVADDTDEIISRDQSADNNVITNPFSIFHENDDEESRECGKLVPRPVMRPLQQQQQRQSQLQDACHAFNHFERQDFGRGGSSAAFKQRSRIIFRKFSLRKWHKSHLTNTNMACNRDVEALPQLKKLKISYPDRTQRETFKSPTPTPTPTPTSTSTYFERLQAKTRQGLQKMRDKCRYFRQTTTAPSARLPATKDLSFRYISDTEHINSYEAHCSLTRKQSLLYKSYKSEFELSKNLHYLDAYLQQNFDQQLSEQKSHSVGRIPARQRTLNAHYVAIEKGGPAHNRQSINYGRGEIVHSDSLSSSAEYASVFSPSFMRTIAAGAGETVADDLAQFNFENLSPSLTVTAGENLLTQFDPTNYPYLHETPAVKKLLPKGSAKQQRELDNVVLVRKRNVIDNKFQLGFNQFGKRRGEKYRGKLWHKEECNNIKHENYLEHFHTRHKQPNRSSSRSRSSSISSNSNNSGCGNPRVEMGNRERVTCDTFAYNQNKKFQQGHEQFYDDGFGENGLTTENINADKCGTNKKLRYTRERSHLHDVIVSAGCGGMLRAADKGSFVISNGGNSAGNKVATTANTFQPTQRVLGVTRPLTFAPHTSLNHLATLRTADSNTSTNNRPYDDDVADDADADADADANDDLPGSRYDSDDESDDDNTRQRDQYTQIDTGNSSGSGSNTTTTTTTNTNTTSNVTLAVAHGSRNTDKYVHNTYSNSTKLMVENSGSRYNFTGSSLHSSSLSTTSASSSSASTTSQTNQQMLATKFYLPNTQYKYEFIQNQQKQQKFQQQQQQQTVGNYQARRRSNHSNSSSDHIEKDNFFHNTSTIGAYSADKLPIPTTPIPAPPTPQTTTPMKTMLTAYDSDVVSPVADYKNAKIRAFSRVLSPALSQLAQQSGAMHQQHQLAHQRHHHYRVTASAIAKEDPTTTTTATPYISALNYYGTGAAVDCLYTHTYASSAKNTCTNFPTPKKQASSTTLMPTTHTTTIAPGAQPTHPAHPVPGYVLEYEC